MVLLSRETDRKEDRWTALFLWCFMILFGSRCWLCVINYCIVLGRFFFKYRTVDGGRVIVLRKIEIGRGEKIVDLPGVRQCSSETIQLLVLWTGVAACSKTSLFYVLVSLNITGGILFHGHKRRTINGTFNKAHLLVRYFRRSWMKKTTWRYRTSST